MTLIIKGEAELYRKLDSLSNVMKKTFWIGVQEDLEKNLLRNIKPHSKTGKLERNAYVKPIQNGVEAGIKDDGMLVGRNGLRVNYGVFVHEGTTDHMIKPNKKKALAWDTPFGRFYSKGHMVKGIKADPYLENAAKETFKNLNKIFTKELHDKGIL